MYPDDRIRDVIKGIDYMLEDEGLSGFVVVFDVLDDDDNMAYLYTVQGRVDYAAVVALSAIINALRKAGVPLEDIPDKLNKVIDMLMQRIYRKEDRWIDLS